MFVLVVGVSLIIFICHALLRCHYTGYTLAAVRTGALVVSGGIACMSSSCAVEYTTIEYLTGRLEEYPTIEHVVGRLENANGGGTCWR